VTDLNGKLLCNAEGLAVLRGRTVPIYLTDHFSCEVGQNSFHAL